MKKFSVMLAVAMLTSVCIISAGCDGSHSSKKTNSETLPREDGEQVISMVNEMLENDRSIAGSARCKRIEIGKKVNSGYYKANAILDNGEKLKINIKYKGDDIIVEIGTLEQVKSMVNDMLKRELASDAAKCLKVKITEKIDKKHYRAIAMLDNGNDLPITIEYEDNDIVVTIVDQ